MNPFYKEFQNDEDVIQAVRRLQADGVKDDDIYVITHDDDRTKRLTEQAEANQVGASELGVGTSIKNLFRKQGDELRAQFKELGFSKQEAEQLEKKLDAGKVIVVVKNKTASMNL
ncbi:general stress protein [Alkalihalobacillus oceani]|uniref:General stress protein n=1 Tax=Halalkalibacter oceani TaxID=1653776 RepID=A0A9X2DN81_9BACI|nr:general stress protein [Halalkalibacter oceani]MCM3713804.1 general stress protein [Halalkalibacter oceani]